MQTWDVTVTLDTPLPDEDTLGEILAALPSGSAVGRSAWSDRLTISVGAWADLPAEAAALGTAFARHAAGTAELDPLPVILGVEALTTEESERRAVEPRAAELLSVSEAAEILGIGAAAVRLRAQQGKHGAVRVGELGWVFPRDAVERAAHPSQQGTPAHRADLATIASRRHAGHLGDDGVQ